MSDSPQRRRLARPAAAAVNGLTRTIVGARLVNGALSGRRSRCRVSAGRRPPCALRHGQCAEISSSLLDDEAWIARPGAFVTARLPSGDRRASTRGRERSFEVVGHFDIDFQRRYLLAPLHPDHDFFRIEHDMPRDRVYRLTAT